MLRSFRILRTTTGRMKHAGDHVIRKQNGAILKAAARAPKGAPDGAAQGDVDKLAGLSRPGDGSRALRVADATRVVEALTQDARPG